MIPKFRSSLERRDVGKRCVRQGFEQAGRDGLPLKKLL